MCRRFSLWEKKNWFASPPSSLRRVIEYAVTIRRHKTPLRPYIVLLLHTNTHTRTNYIRDLFGGVSLGQKKNPRKKIIPRDDDIVYNRFTEDQNLISFLQSSRHKNTQRRAVCAVSSVFTQTRWKNVYAFNTIYNEYIQYTVHLI